MRVSTARIVVSLGAATMIACSPLNPAAPTELSNANSRTVAPSELATHLQSDGGTAVRIVSGELTVLRGAGVTRTLELKGTAGMRLVANFEPAAFFSADDCEPCLPGDAVRLDGLLSGLSLGGTLTFRGRTYRLGMGNFDAGAHLVFTGTEDLVMPPFSTGGTVTLQAPFALAGKFDIPGPPPAGGATRYALSGQGIATLVFEERRAAPEVPVWFITSVVFNFAH